MNFWPIFCDNIECVHMIFDYLNIADLSSAHSVSKKWNDLLQHNVLWEKWLPVHLNSGEEKAGKLEFAEREVKKIVYANLLSSFQCDELNFIRIRSIEDFVFKVDRSVVENVKQNSTQIEYRFIQDASSVAIIEVMFCKNGINLRRFRKVFLVAEDPPTVSVGEMLTDDCCVHKTQKATIDFFSMEAKFAYVQTMILPNSHVGLNVEKVDVVKSLMKKLKLMNGLEKQFQNERDIYFQAFIVAIVGIVVNDQNQHSDPIFKTACLVGFFGIFILIHSLSSHSVL